MTQLNLMRHLDVFDPETLGERSVCVVGLDEAGSRTAVELAKLGVQTLHIQDTDSVSEDDVVNHVFRRSDVGENKAVALGRYIQELTGRKVHVHTEPVTGGNMELGTVVLLFGKSNQARQEIWRDYLELNAITQLVIQPSNSGTSLGIVNLDPNDMDDIDFWEERYADGEIVDESVRLNASDAAVVAGYAVWQFIYWIAIDSGQRENNFKREVEIPMQRCADLRPLTGREIFVIGSGATGSRGITYLSQLGADKITVYDDDKVEAHNVPNQAFGLNHVGQMKVRATADIVRAQTGLELDSRETRVGKDTSGIGAIVLMLVDSMTARNEIFDALRDRNDIELIAETRMNSDNGYVYLIDPRVASQADAWKRSAAYGDDLAERSACGGSISVGPTAMLISGLAVSAMVRWLNSSEPEQAPDNELLVHLAPHEVLQTRF